MPVRPLEERRDWRGIPAPLRAQLMAALARAAPEGTGRACWRAAQPFVEQALRHVEVRAGAEPLLVADALLTLAYSLPDPPDVDRVLQDLAAWAA